MHEVKLSVGAQLKVVHLSFQNFGLNISFGVGKVWYKIVNGGKGLLNSLPDVRTPQFPLGTPHLIP